MMLYDIIHCSYDLGPGFWNRDIQTKDLDGYLAEYWLDGSGRLWSIDYSGTHSFEDDTYKPIPNGNRGAIRPYYLTKQIEVYPVKWTAQYAPYPRLTISFVDGKLCTKN
tara:strand:- start:6141 stop:6467 length:327 start_codon:yes stop_codon:yes gene_type:complete